MNSHASRDAILAAIGRGEAAADAGQVIPPEMVPGTNPFATHLHAISWTEPAWKDVESIKQRLAQKDPAEAKELAFAIIAKAGTLGVFPIAGTPFPPGSSGPYREVNLARRFRIFYRVVVAARRIDVLAVRDSANDADLND